MKETVICADYFYTEQGSNRRYYGIQEINYSMVEIEETVIKLVAQQFPERKIEKGSIEILIL